MGKALTISKVSALTGVTVDTIRFYERKGLIPRPIRNHAGYRIYTAEMVGRIKFIRQARNYGFSLVEIEDLLAIAKAGPTVCSGMKERLQRRIAAIDGDLEHLKAMRDRLEQLTVVCSDQRPCRDCHLISAITQAHPG